MRGLTGIPLTDQQHEADAQPALTKAYQRSHSVAHGGGGVDDFQHEAQWDGMRPTSIPVSTSVLAPRPSHLPRQASKPTEAIARARRAVTLCPGLLRSSGVSHACFPGQQMGPSVDCAHHAHHAHPTSPCHKDTATLASYAHSTFRMLVPSPLDSSRCIGISLQTVRSLSPRIKSIVHSRSHRNVDASTCSRRAVR